MIEILGHSLFLRSVLAKLRDRQTDTERKRVRDGDTERDGDRALIYSRFSAELETPLISASAVPHRRTWRKR